MATLSSYNAIQASEDPRVNLSAFLQLHDLKLKGDKSFSPDKPYFMFRPQGGGASRTHQMVNEAYTNSLSSMGVNELAAQQFKNMLSDVSAFRIQEPQASEVGGFTYNDTKRIVDRIMDNPAEYRNSFIDGLPFTYGLSMANANYPMAETPSFDFLGELDFAMPATGTLFSTGEVINMLDIGGTPTDITNGGTTMGQASFGGSQAMVKYHTYGLGLANLETDISGVTGGFAGDAMIQSIYGYALELKKKQMLAGMMRSIYNTLATTEDDGGNNLVPTYTINDIAGIAGTSLQELFGSSTGIGNFISKVIPALNSPANKWLETNQRALDRMVVPISFLSAFQRNVATYGLTGGTQGQVPAAQTLEQALTGIKVSYGSDITPTSSPKDNELRFLLVSDPIGDNRRAEHGFMRVVVALAPTIMAAYNGAGFTNQCLISRFSEPRIMTAKSAIFLTGSK